MSNLYLGTALFLLLNIIVGLMRVWRGPTPADRMMAAQLFGTTGVAIMLLLAASFDVAAIRAVGLVFAILAVIASAVFVRRDATRINPEAPWSHG
jgi:multicomponent Na+:H+ antiporter subunit F